MGDYEQHPVDVDDVDHFNTSIVSHTKQPDETVCTAARGDQTSDSVVGTDPHPLMDQYQELLAPVEYDDEDFPEWCDEDWASENDYFACTEARTRALIRLLIRREHLGPFEHPSITFAIEGISRVAMAQLTRHRHATFDVQSMRVVDPTDNDIVVPPSVTEKWSTMEWSKASRTIEGFYEDLLDAGVPQEDARMILPLATRVNCTMTVNLRSLFHIMEMRRNGAAQWEVRALADQLLDDAETVAPYSVAIYREYGRNKGW